MRRPTLKYAASCPKHMVFDIECHKCVVFTLARLGEEIDQLKKDLHKEITESRRNK